MEKPAKLTASQRQSLDIDCRLRSHERRIRKMIRFNDSMVASKTRGGRQQQAELKLQYNDGWQNVLTNYGTGRDKRKANRARWTLGLLEQEAEELYAADPTAHRIVDLPPHEATREWITFDDDKLGNEIEEEIERLHVQENLLDGSVYSRLYGGSVLFVNDGTASKDLGRTFNEEGLVKLRSMTVLNRWEAWVWATSIQRDLSKENFGQPDTYHLFPRMALGQVGMAANHSRFIRFDGKKLPRMLKIRNNFWGDSMLTALRESIGDYKVSMAAVASLLQDFRLLVHYIEGLTDIIAAGGEQAVASRLEIMNMARSVIGMMVIDGKDKIEVQRGGLEGVAEAVKLVRDRLQGDTDIPHTILWNESPSGLGATGGSEQGVWYDTVKAYQKNFLRPRLNQILKLIFLQKSGPTGGKIPKNWKYTFNPLFQQDDQEKADTRLKNAQADQIHVNLGATNGEEVRHAAYPERVAKDPNFKPDLPDEPELPGLEDEAGASAATQAAKAAGEEV